MTQVEERNYISERYVLKRSLLVVRRNQVDIEQINDTMKQQKE